jgi:HopJ type III effector protein
MEIMSIENFIEKLSADPSQISFNQTMLVIENNYNYTPTKFLNGAIVNEAGKNEGSCKLFAFAKLMDFNKEQTLNCFGDFYRVDVLENPDKEDHQNIRNFIVQGWAGIDFKGEPLRKI